MCYKKKKKTTIHTFIYISPQVHIKHYIWSYQSQYKTIHLVISHKSYQSHTTLVYQQTIHFTVHTKHYNWSYQKQSTTYTTTTPDPSSHWSELVLKNSLKNSELVLENMVLCLLFLDSDLDFENMTSCLWFMVSRMKFLYSLTTFFT